MRLFCFWRCLIYSVALDRTVALFSLCAGVSPSRASSPLSALFVLDTTRRAGTLSLKAAILSLRLFLYRVSIILWEDFLFPGSVSFESSSFKDALRFLRFVECGGESSE